MQGGAGESQALWDASEVSGGNVADAVDNGVDAVVEVFSFVFNDALYWAAKCADVKALVLQCNVVNEFFFIIVKLLKESVLVLEGILNYGQVDKSELVTSTSALICSGLRDERLCSFEAGG